MGGRVLKGAFATMPALMTKCWEPQGAEVDSHSTGRTEAEMPASLPISLADCLHGGFRVTTHCDHCRTGSSPHLAHLVEAAGPAASRPILELFDAGKLVFARCLKPWSGLEIERQGPRPLDAAAIVRFWRPGSMSDPEVAAYWRGRREASGR